MTSGAAFDGETERWLAAQGWAEATLEPLRGDVSPRRYVRVRASRRSGILALYPETLRATAERFLRTGELLEGVGVRVPRVLAADVDGGRMLLEDLGTETLYERPLDWSARARWWRAAAATLLALRRLDAAAIMPLNPALDTALLRREIRQTAELVLEPALSGEAALLEDTLAMLDAICLTLGDTTLVPCHRDFMARNLVPLDEGALAVLDHQDLRLGPPAYDWASLLNDSLFAPADLERGVLELGAEVGVDLDDYRRAAVQRGFKAVGTFVSFARRGSDRHLPLVAPTLARSLDHLGRLAAGAELAPALRRALVRADLLQ